MSFERDAAHHRLLERVFGALHNLTKEDPQYQYTFAGVAAHCLQELGIPLELENGKNAGRFKVTRATFNGVVKGEIEKFTDDSFEQHMLLGQVLIRLLEPIRGRLTHEYLMSEMTQESSRVKK